MKLRAVLILMIILFWFRAAALPQETALQENRHSYLVSLIQVIANPNDFNEQHIRVIGFLGHSGLDRALGLYVSEVDGRNFITCNSVDVRVKETEVKGLTGSYVSLSGIYHAPSPRSGYNGYIDHILEVKPLRPVSPGNSSK